MADLPVLKKIIELSHHIKSLLLKSPSISLTDHEASKINALETQQADKIGEFLSEHQSVLTFIESPVSVPSPGLLHFAYVMVGLIGICISIYGLKWLKNFNQEKFLPFMTRQYHDLLLRVSLKASQKYHNLYKERYQRKLNYRYTQLYKEEKLQRERASWTSWVSGKISGLTNMAALLTHPTKIPKQLLTMMRQPAFFYTVLMGYLSGVKIPYLQSSVSLDQVIILALINVIVLIYDFINNLIDTEILGKGQDSFFRRIYDQLLLSYYFLLTSKIMHVDLPVEIKMSLNQKSRSSRLGQTSFTLKRSSRSRSRGYESDDNKNDIEDSNPDVDEESNPDVDEDSKPDLKEELKQDLGKKSKKDLNHDSRVKSSSSKFSKFPFSLADILEKKYDYIYKSKNDPNSDIITTKIDYTLTKEKIKKLPVLTDAQKDQYFNLIQEIRGIKDLIEMMHSVDTSTTIEKLRSLDPRYQKSHESLSRPCNHQVDPDCADDENIKTIDPVIVEQLAQEIELDIHNPEFSKTISRIMTAREAEEANEEAMENARNQKYGTVLQSIAIGPSLTNKIYSFSKLHEINGSNVENRGFLGRIIYLNSAEFEIKLVKSINFLTSTLIESELLSQEIIGKIKIVFPFMNENPDTKEKKSITKQEKKVVIDKLIHIQQHHDFHNWKKLIDSLKLIKNYVASQIVTFIRKIHDEILMARKKHDDIKIKNMGDDEKKSKTASKNESDVESTPKSIMPTKKASSVTSREETEHFVTYKMNEQQEKLISTYGIPAIFILNPDLKKQQKDQEKNELYYYRNNLNNAERKFLEDYLIKNNRILTTINDFIPISLQMSTILDHLLQVKNDYLKILNIIYSKHEKIINIWTMLCYLVDHESNLFYSTVITLKLCIENRVAPKNFSTPSLEEMFNLDFDHIFQVSSSSDAPGMLMKPYFTEINYINFFQTPDEKNKYHASLKNLLNLSCQWINFYTHLFDKKFFNVPDDPHNKTNLLELSKQINLSKKIFSTEECSKDISLTDAEKSIINEIKCDHQNTEINNQLQSKINLHLNQDLNSKYNIVAGYKNRRSPTPKKSRLNK